MKSSLYLDRFKVAEGALPILVGDVILVEKIEFEERRTKSGLILDVSTKQQVGALTADKPHFVRVLAVGAGFYNDETKEDVPLDVKPGDIVLVGQMSVRYFSLFADMDPYKPDSIGVTRESEILIKFKDGEEGYNRAMQALNSLSGPVEGAVDGAESGV